MTPMYNRPHVSKSSWIATVLRKRSTWHFDAWLLDASGELWFRIELSEGGIRGVALHWYRITRRCDAVERYIVQREPDNAKWPRELEAVERYIDSRKLKERGWDMDMLERLHWTFIYPLVRKPAPYKWLSAALHYIRPASIDPVEGFENYQRYTRRVDARAERHPVKPFKGTRVASSGFMHEDSEDIRPLASLAHIL